jgi:cation diffusion facilitator family transporter
METAVSATFPAASAPDDAAHAVAQREKHVVALSSVLAAVLLTSTKVVVGLLTGSLGILAEAAHSGLDLAAAVMTLFAVRFSGRAADRSHPYGHGKIENLSALFETLLLLGTCVWIVWEAVHRLVAEESAHVHANVWAFGVVILSIVVDVSRSRALYRVAKKYDSQALEADALHFSTDILSSSVVLVGLVGVVLADRLGLLLLEKADTLAALGVAAVSIAISCRLGVKTVTDLLDAVPPGLRDEIDRAVQRVPGVLDVRQVRVRRSGPEAFADVTVGVGYDTAFERVHEITRAVEEAVRAVLRKADVLVHAEPAAIGSGDLQAAARSLAARLGLVAHDIRIVDVDGGGRALDLHLEVEPSLSVGQAHAQADAFESALRQEHPALLGVTTHLEPAAEHAARIPVSPGDDRRIREAVEASASELGVRLQAHDVEVWRSAEGLSVTFHCLLDPGLGIQAAHDLTMRLEQVVRARVPDIRRVVIHVEPRPLPAAADAPPVRPSDDLNSPPI